MKKRKENRQRIRNAYVQKKGHSIEKKQKAFNKEPAAWATEENLVTMTIDENRSNIFQDAVILCKSFSPDCSIINAKNMIHFV